MLLRSIRGVTIKIQVPNNTLTIANFIDKGTSRFTFTLPFEKDAPKKGVCLGNDTTFKPLQKWVYRSFIESTPFWGPPFSNGRVYKKGTGHRCVRQSCPRWHSLKIRRQVNFNWPAFLIGLVRSMVFANLNNLFYH